MSDVIMLNPNEGNRRSMCSGAFLFGYFLLGVQEKVRKTFCNTNVSMNTSSIRNAYSLSLLVSFTSSNRRLSSGSSSARCMTSLRRKRNKVDGMTALTVAVRF